MTLVYSSQHPYLGGVISQRDFLTLNTAWVDPHGQAARRMTVAQSDCTALRTARCMYGLVYDHTRILIDMVSLIMTLPG